MLEDALAVTATLVLQKHSSIVYCFAATVRCCFIVVSILLFAMITIHTKYLNYDYAYWGVLTGKSSRENATNQSINQARTMLNVIAATNKEAKKNNSFVFGVYTIYLRVLVVVIIYGTSSYITTAASSRLQT